jgi:hypothetical protein
VPAKSFGDTAETFPETFLIGRRSRFDGFFTLATFQKHSGESGRIHKALTVNALRFFNVHSRHFSQA